MPAVPEPLAPVHLTAADPKRSIRFYETLGFELSECWPDRRKPLRATLQLDGQGLTIVSLIPAKKFASSGASKEERRLHKKELKAFKKHRHGVGLQVHVSVSDVDRHCQERRRKRVALVSRLRTRPHGVRDYSVVDPDGYRIVFYSPAPAEPARSIRPQRRRRPAVERVEATVEVLATPSPAIP